MATKKMIPNTSAFEIIEESINKGESIRLKVRGKCMSPKLMDGVDTITLSPFNVRFLKVGEIIFFRHNGRHLLHRIINIERVNGGNGDFLIELTTKGDALKTTEKITPADIVAVASVPEHSELRLLFRIVIINISSALRMIRKFLKSL